MFALSGTVDRLHLGDLFEWLNLSHATGRLLLTAGAVTRAFDLVKGKVAFASSSRAAERLASWLLRKGVVKRDLLLRALAVSQTQGEPFTLVLEQEAEVSHETLLVNGRALATALASRVMREDRVTFRFDQSWPVTDHLHVDLQLECGKLLMEAAYRVDTRPPADQLTEEPPTTLDPDTIEAVFWRIADDLAGEEVDASAFAAAHRTLLAVGNLLHRWVTQGPPLLPLGPADVARIAARIEHGKAVRLEDSPTLTWDLLSLVNGLDAPGFSRATSTPEALVMAGGDASALVRLIVENLRWRRERRGDSDDTLYRAGLARAAAGRALAAPLGLPQETAAAAAVLPVVLLELVATALATAPLASPAMQRAALKQLLPLVGHAAGTAAGLPDVLFAALTGSPPEHIGARMAGLAALAAGDAGMNVTGGEPLDESTDVALAPVLAAAREAAEKAVLAASE